MRKISSNKILINSNNELDIIFEMNTDDKNTNNVLNNSINERIGTEKKLGSRMTSQNLKSYFNSDSEEIKFKDYKNMKFDDIKDHTIQFSYSKIL